MAAEDPYATLGLAKTASAEDIRRAFRKLAKQYHPDLNPGDQAAEAKFKAASAAHTLLSDEEQRAKFDRGEIDAQGQERGARGFWRQHAEGMGAAGAAGANRYGGRAQEIDPEEFGDIFASMFGGGGRGGFRAPKRGADRPFTLAVDFVVAARGGTERITLPAGGGATGGAIELRIPPGTRDGQTLRLAGKGEPGLAGAPAGDALVEVHVRPHPFFRRDGDDIRLDLPVSLPEAVLGAKVPVPTVDGPVTLTIPKGANSGTVLRLKGRGVAKGEGGNGDQYVTLSVRLPETIDPDLEQAVERWAAQHPYDARRKMPGG